MLLKRFYNLLFRRKLSIAEMVACVFSERDHYVARSFYESWAGEEYLVVEIGDGSHGLFDRDEFFKAAFFSFFASPLKIDGFHMIGAHIEDTAGMIVVERESGKVFYAYEELNPTTMTLLAESFTDFLVRLRAAGWAGPVRD
jgi:hypothetical protein